MNKPRAIQQSQMLSETAEESGLTIAAVKKALEAYEKVSRRGILNGKKVPLPGGMGYIYAGLTRSKNQEVYLKLSDTHTDIPPKLRTIANFSDPWKKSINADPLSETLIKKLLEQKNEE